MNTIQIANFAVYKNHATGIWIIKDRATSKEVAHEPNKKSALIAARRLAK